MTMIPTFYKKKTPDISRLLNQKDDIFFSKLHHTFDEDGNLRFFFVCDYDNLKNQLGVITARIMRHRIENPSGDYKESKEIELTAVSDFSTGNDKGFVYFTGTDSDFNKQARYDYKVTLFILSKNTSAYKTPLAVDTMQFNSGNVPSGLLELNNVFPTVQYEEGQQIPLSLKETGIGCKMATVQNVKILYSTNVFITQEESNRFLKRPSMEKVDKFVKFKNVSKKKDLGGFNIGTTTNLATKQKDDNPNNYLEVNSIETSEHINLEYLSIYNTMYLDKSNSVTLENWQPITHAVLDSLAGKKILVRINTPEAVVNKYFFVQE